MERPKDDNSPTPELTLSKDKLPVIKKIFFLSYKAPVKADNPGRRLLTISECL